MKKKAAMRFSIILLATFSVATQASDVLENNPFERPDWAGTSANNVTSGGMQLRGTVIDGNNSLVNIDGKHYRLKEEVSGYLIIRIESGSVTLRRGENETVLVLKDEE